MKHTSCTFLSLLAGISLFGNPASDSGRVRRNFAKLPLCFEANQGQTNSVVQYLAHGRGYTLFFTPAEMALRLNAAGGAETAPVVLRMRLPGSKANASLEALDPLPGTTNYLIGNDPRQWRKNVPSYGRVAYRDVYPGVDLVYRGSQRQLEFDFVVRPGGDPRPIRIAFEGAQTLGLTAKGDLRLDAGDRRLVLHKPVLYQESSQGRIAIASAFVQREKNEFAFDVAKYDSSKPLIVDPALEIAYATLFGGSGDEAAFGIAVDGGGNAYIAGTTSSSADFPTKNPAQATYGGGNTDFFVTKFNPGGTGIIYSTYLGGSGDELGDSGVSGGIDNYTGILAVDPSGNAYVTGRTKSANFPTTANAFSQTLVGGATFDGFVTKLSPNGSTLLYSTYLGDSIGLSYPRGIAADNAGNAYITGLSLGNTLPTTATAYSIVGASFSSPFIGFLTKFNTTASGAASLAYSSYLGGTNNGGMSVAVDNSGNAYVGGELYLVAGSGGGTIPAVNAIQSFSTGAPDGFVQKFNTTATVGALSLVWSTYLGGSKFDYVQKVAIDSTGVYLTGATDSNDFITTPGAFSQTYGGGGDIFVTKLSLNGASRLYSTYIGGTGNDLAYDMSIDSLNNVYLAGPTASANFPQINNNIPPPVNGGAQYALGLNAAGSALLYSASFGGDPQVRALAADPSGNVFITGQASTSTGLPPTFGAYQSTLKGNSDAFLAKLTVGGNGALLIGAVAPNRGGSSDFIKVTIQGFGIASGASVKLVSAGGTIAGTSPSVAPDGSSLTALFNLVGAAQEVYDVTITNPNGATGTLPMAFTVQSTVLTIIPSTGGNAGTMSPSVRGPSGVFSPGTTAKLTGSTTITGSGTLFNSDGSAITPTFNLVGAPPGAYTLTVNNSDGTFLVSPGGFTVQAGGRPELQISLTGPPFFGAGHTQTYFYSVCTSGIIDAQNVILNIQVSPNISPFTLNVPSTFSMAGGLNNYQVQVPLLRTGDCFTVQGFAHTDPNTPAHTPASNRAEAFILPGDNFLDPLVEPILIPHVMINGDTDIRTPHDPNDKAGPTGGGGAAQYILGQSVIPYLIYFENQATASAPAQNVTITDTLDPGLDPNTLSFGVIGFGSQAVTPPGGNNDFNTVVDLRPAQPLEVKISAHYDPPSNTITWTYLSIDPKTGETPNDPSLGFLPPNVTSPQGQGYVYFTVMPRSGQITGTQIQNQASIVFDFQPSISTANWLNTLDVDLPVSAVAALPAVENSACFSVSWSGTDVGSGISNYTIFVSDNGGPFALWLNSTLTSATYPGQAGHSYAFYSVAQDAAGNLEKKSVADTSTSVSTNAASCGQVAAPNAVGLTEVAAVTAVTGAGLVLGTVTTAPSSTVPAGNVISQSPVAATQVNAGSPINLVVSSGPSGTTQVAVPNVVGQTQAAATTAITGAGLVLGTVTTASSSTVPSGSVISESPVAGTMVNTGSAVNLVVSSGPAQVAVPNVVGQTQAAATTAITGAGLVVGTVTTASSSTVPSGSVISESPVAGTSVNTGSAVNLVVSSGPAQVAVPNVVGQTQAAATTAITGAGLVLGTVTTASSGTVPSGNVISESPLAGTQVNTGSAVNLVVSSGPAQVAVPNVVGSTQTAATTAITGAGLVVGTVTTAHSTTVPSGSVISESPLAGTQVNTGSAVNLVVSSGPAQVAVPNVVGQTQAAATTAITGAGLVLGTVTTASSSTVPSGSVVSESPVAGTSVNTGSAVNLVVSSGPAQVAVPNVVGLTQAAATTAITGAGLALGTVTTVSSGTVPSGSVISESPVAGTQVNTGSAVNLVVSSGPALKPQTITFNAIASKVQGKPLTLSASASSGLAVIFTSSTPTICTVSGTTATLVSAGTCTIVASQPGNAVYAAATPVSQSFMVQAAYTITPIPNAETVVVGDIAAFALEVRSTTGFTGSITLSCSGGPSGASCTDLPATIRLFDGYGLAFSGVLFPKSTPPGTYTMTFKGVSGAITNSATATFTVKPR